MKSRSKLELAILELIEREKVYRSCLSCHYFEEAAESCKLASARPPARIIVQGCDKYLEEPPF